MKCLTPFLFVLAGCTSVPHIWNFDDAPSAAGLTHSVSVHPGTRDEPSDAVFEVTGLEASHEPVWIPNSSPYWSLEIVAMEPGTMDISLHLDGNTETEPDAFAEGFDVAEPTLLAVDVGPEIPGRPPTDTSPIQFLASLDHSWVLSVVDATGQHLGGTGNLLLLGSPWPSLSTLGGDFNNDRLILNRSWQETTASTNGSPTTEGPISIELLNGETLSTPDFVPRIVETGFSIGLVHTGDLAVIRLQDELGDPVVTNLVHEHLNSLLEGVTLPELAETFLPCGWDLEVDSSSEPHTVQYCIGPLCTSAVIPGRLQVPTSSECDDFFLSEDGFIDMSED